MGGNSILFLLDSTAENIGTCTDSIGWPNFEETLRTNKDTATQMKRLRNEEKRN